MAQTVLLPFRLEEKITNWFIALGPSFVAWFLLLILAIMYDCWNHRVKFGEEELSWLQCFEFSDEIVPFSFVSSTWTNLCGTNFFSVWSQIIQIVWKKKEGSLHIWDYFKLVHFWCYFVHGRMWQDQFRCIVSFCH